MTRKVNHLPNGYDPQKAPTRSKGYTRIFQLLYATKGREFLDERWEEMKADRTFAATPIENFVKSVMGQSSHAREQARSEFMLQIEENKLWLAFDKSRFKNPPASQVMHTCTIKALPDRG